MAPLLVLCSLLLAAPVLGQTVAPIWSYNASWAVSEPVIADGAVIWATRDALISAQATTGVVSWKRAGVFSTPAVVANDDKAYVIVSNQQAQTVSLLGAVDGRPKWVVKNVQAVGLQAPVVAVDHDIAVVLGSTGAVGISLRVGKVIWTATGVVGNASTRVSGCGDYVYVALQNQAIVALSAKSGKVLWTHDVPVMFAVAPVDSAKARCAFAVAEVVVPFPNAWLRGPDCSNMAFDAMSGTMLWNISNEYASFASPAQDATGIVVFATYYGNFFKSTQLTWYNVSNATTYYAGSPNFDLSGIPTNVPSINAHIIGTYQQVSSITNITSYAMVYNWQVTTTGYVDHQPVVSVPDGVVAVRDDAGFMYAMWLQPSIGPTTTVPPS